MFGRFFILIIIVAYRLVIGDIAAGWHFDESSGKTLTDVFNQTGGALLGARISFVQSGAGINGANFGNCLWTDNLNDYAELGDLESLDFGSNDFTVTGWFKTANAARHGYLIRNGAHNGGGYSVFIFKNTGNLCFQVNSVTPSYESDNKIIISELPQNDNKWHWFAACVQNQKMYLYVDGVLQSSSGVIYGGSTSATANASLAAYINKDAAAWVDEILVYDTALSSQLNGNLLVGGELYNNWQKLGVPQNCGQAGALGYRQAGDINNDCRVNLEDFSMFAFGWLGTFNSHIPLLWRKPISFDEQAVNLGITPLQGITHRLLYEPLASSACLSEGGSGVYESTLHGTYNHHQQLFVYDDKFVVYWTNHAKDENGPGQRLLAKAGKFNADKSDIDFDAAGGVIEIAPPAALADRRLYTHNGNLISELFVSGGFLVINGGIYLIGDIHAMAGWTDEPIYHGAASVPVPLEHWRDNREGDFNLDVWWKIGRFYQKWHFNGDNLEPQSPVYKHSDFVTAIEVTPKSFRAVAQIAAYYKNALALSGAAYQFRYDVLSGIPEPFSRTAFFGESSSKRIAADALNGLAHIASYRTPHGGWVVVRDNLSNPGIYYAASIDDYYAQCPPAWPTNLYGFAQPDARELPDGRPYIICSGLGRKDMFITVSDDGYLFGKTWHLLRSERVKSDGGLFKSGGPQYFRSYVVGGNIWVVYSITKEQIGLTKIPVELLK